MSCKVPTINPQPDPTSQRRVTCGGLRGAPRLGEVGRDDLRRERIREWSMQTKPRVTSLAVYNMRQAWVGRRPRPINLPNSVWRFFAPVYPAATLECSHVLPFPSQLCFLTTVTYTTIVQRTFMMRKRGSPSEHLRPAAFLIPSLIQYLKEQGLVIS